jgi:histidine triad (HIT) family protein
MEKIPFELPGARTCYFCEQLAADEPPGLIAESDLTATLVNARQHQEGQVVVIPKRHAPTLLNLSEEEAIDAMLAARRVGYALIDAYDMDGMLLYQNNGVASGQEVPHFHLHVCPQRLAVSRWGNEPPHVADAVGRDFRPDPPTWLTAEEMQEVAGRIRACL